MLKETMLDSCRSHIINDNSAVFLIYVSRICRASRRDIRYLLLFVYQGCKVHTWRETSGSQAEGTIRGKVNCQT